MPERFGVGFVGAGAATQAIHLPTLARLAGDFEVRGLTDVDPVLARTVADRFGATVHPDVTTLAADPAIDIVCICSPERFHVAQVAAASRAGARAVLCEKPLGVDAADAAELLAAGTRVPLVVGTMHVTDPAWERAWAVARDGIGDLLAVDSSVVLPVNRRFEREGAEIAVPAAAALAPETPAETLRRRFLLLSIHDLPLVRAALGGPVEADVVAAQLLDPIGYAVLARSGDVPVRFLGSMREHWEPTWDLRITGTAGEVRARFPPPFVQTGSARVEVATADGTRVFEGLDDSGYTGEWRLLARILRGEAAAPDVRDLIDDLAFAVAIADRAAAVIAGGPR